MKFITMWPIKVGLRSAYLDNRYTSWRRIHRTLSQWGWYLHFLRGYSYWNWATGTSFGKASVCWLSLCTGYVIITWSYNYNNSLNLKLLKYYDHHVSTVCTPLWEEFIELSSSGAGVVITTWSRHCDEFS